ncbi:MAG: FecR domain-containing protein [Bdellovibrionales bacterium]
MYVCYSWVIALALLVPMSMANAQNVHGVLRVVKGNVQIKSAKTGQTERARIGAKVFPKDTIITAKDARAKIVMVDNNEINVSPESQIEIQNYEYDPAAGKKDVLLNVIYGKVRSKVEQKYDGKTSKFQIKTPAAVAGVRGTDFICGHSLASGLSNVVTFHGQVAFGVPGPGGAIMNPVLVNPGLQANIGTDGKVSPPAPVPPGMLARMDADSKADGPKPSGESRQPSGDNKGGDKNKGEKKEGDKNGEKKPDAKGDNKGGDKAGDKKADGGNKGGNGNGAKGPGGTAGNGGGSAGGQGGNGDPNDGGPRGPASDPNKSPGPGCTMCKVDGPGPDPLPPPFENPNPCAGGICSPPPPPPQPGFVDCAVCNDPSVTNGKTLLRIHVNTGN